MREIASLENMLLQRLGEEDTCAVCADHNTVECPGLNLCGKTVLYVGGLHKMVPHYRQLVEHLGGRFMHHDGGKEASRNLLGLPRENMYLTGIKGLDISPDQFRVIVSEKKKAGCCGRCRDCKCHDGNLDP